MAFLTEKANEDKPLSVEQLEQAAGGDGIDFSSFFVKNFTIVQFICYGY